MCLNQVFNHVENTLKFTVFVKTGSKLSKIPTGIEDKKIIMAVKSQPVKNKANNECITLISKWLKVRKKDVIITSGMQSRQKTIKVVNFRESYHSFISKIRSELR